MVKALSIHVGINRYLDVLNVRDLVSCEQDAMLMERVTPAFDVIAPLNSEDATYINIYDAFRDAASQFRGSGEPGYFLITFAGHGMSASSEWGRGWCLYNQILPRGGDVLPFARARVSLERGGRRASALP